MVTISVADLREIIDAGIYWVEVSGGDPPDQIIEKLKSLGIGVSDGDQ